MPVGVAGVPGAAGATEARGAVGEGGGRRGERPRRRQLAVEVLEETGEALRGLGVREAAERGQRVRAGRKGERADVVVMQDPERRTGGRHGRLASAGGVTAVSETQVVISAVAIREERSMEAPSRRPPRRSSVPGYGSSRHRLRRAMAQAIEMPDPDDLQRALQRTGAELIEREPTPRPRRPTRAEGGRCPRPTAAQRASGRRSP